MKIQMTSQWESKQWKLQQKPTKKFKKKTGFFFKRQISPIIDFSFILVLLSNQKKPQKGNKFEKMLKKKLYFIWI